MGPPKAGAARARVAHAKAMAPKVRVAEQGRLLKDIFIRSPGDSLPGSHFTCAQTSYACASGHTCRDGSERDEVACNLRKTEAHGAASGKAVYFAATD
jgi:hypothetical protein